MQIPKWVLRVTYECNKVSEPLFFSDMDRLGGWGPKQSCVAGDDDDDVADITGFVGDVAGDDDGDVDDASEEEW